MSNRCRANRPDVARWGPTPLSWKATGQILADQGYHVVAIDTRGHGDSDRAPDADYALEVVELVLVDVVPRYEKDNSARIRDFMFSHPNGFASLGEAAAAVDLKIPILLIRGKLSDVVSPESVQGFSSCPPNCLRIADNTLAPNSKSWREAKRAYRAVVNTGAGTPSSIAAITVHRPSPLSDTRPANSLNAGDSCSADAVKSSSHELITLPRRHTSATAGMSMSYW
ncbi:peroxidase BpoB [Mycobacterium haemophilum DSM 44634]